MKNDKNKKRNIDSIFWFRRDLRLHDNVGLFHALSESDSVLPVFVFDKEILDRLEDKTDARVEFIHDQLKLIQGKLRQRKKDLYVVYGDTKQEIEKLISEYSPKKIYTNRDYEPYARVRDKAIKSLTMEHGVEFHAFKDQVIFEPGEVLKDDGGWYSVYTPYFNKWKKHFTEKSLTRYPSEEKLENCATISCQEIPSLQTLGFRESDIHVPNILSDKELERVINAYKKTREQPAREQGTSRLGIHLRFGTVSIRHLTELATESRDTTWASELVWREFFMQLLWFNPKTPKEAFKEKYDKIKWRSGKQADADYDAWCKGETGYALVDAGMRELNETGYMHNRVRMLTASFLCKHLLIDWRKGERYFAKKLLDYELASNVGNWQWAAGSGADAAPYFRIFNPYTQREKFDPDWEYVKRWAPEYTTDNHPEEIVDYKKGRERALQVYKDAVG